jgi:hypothetical protein
MNYTILELVLRLGVALAEYLGDSRRVEYICTACECQAPCAQEAPGGNRRSKLAPYNPPHKVSYKEILGDYGTQQVEGVLWHAQRALAAQDPRAACAIGRRLDHLRPVLWRDELSDLRRDVTSFSEELSGLCRGG